MASAAAAAGYVDEYDRALGVDDVHVARVLGFGKAYWVYAVEDDTGRPAFSLEVRPDGGIEVRKFPGMQPEMMWNQKYGHEARPDPDMIEAGIGEEEAARRLREALPGGGEIKPGKVSAYYGYFLFPLCEADRQVGEAAVDAMHGEVVWRPFPESPRSTWVAPGADRNSCE